MSDERLVCAREAAKALGMGVGSLYKLSHARKVPSYAAGPRLRGV